MLNRRRKFATIRIRVTVHPLEQVESGVVATPFRLATIDGVLSFFSTTTLFSTPVDMTVSELAIEAFLPADAETAKIVRRVAQRDSTEPTTVAQSAAETGLVLDGPWGSSRFCKTLA